MDELLLTPDQRWHGTGLTAAWFREKAEWIQRDSGAPGAIGHYFNSTARLLRSVGMTTYFWGRCFSMPLSVSKRCCECITRSEFPMPFERCSKRQFGKV